MRFRMCCLMLVFVVIAACADDIAPKNQQTDSSKVYIDATLGNDSNPGSASAPWRSFANIDATTITAGMSILLKRGEVWRESLVLPASDIRVDAYGEGALPKIDGSTALSGWSSLGANIYSSTVSLAAGQGLGNLSQDGLMMQFVPWNDNYTTTLAAAVEASFSYEYSSNTLYIFTSTDPALAQFRASVNYFGISADGLQNINIANVDISRFSLLGVNFKNCVNCSISDSHISQGGGAVLADLGAAANPDYLYAGNGIEFGNSASNGIVNNVTLSEIFDSAVSPQTYASNESASNFVFNNVSIDKAGFAGIEISVLDNNGTSGSSIDGVAISNTTISNSGKGWSGQRYGSEGYGIRIKADSGAGSISNVSIENTSVALSVNSAIHIAGNSNTVTIRAARVFNNDSHGVALEEASETTPLLQVYSSLIYGNGGYGIAYNSPTASGFSVINNTFYNNTTTHFGVLSHNGGARIQNNIFHSNTGMNDLYIALVLSAATIDNNCFEDHANMFNYNNSLYSSVSSFNTDHASFEVNGTGSGSIGMLDPAMNDFSLGASSSCKILGAVVSDPLLDINGQSFANPRTSGAIQYY